MPQLPKWLDRILRKNTGSPETKSGIPESTRFLDYRVAIQDLTGNEEGSEPVYNIRITKDVIPNVAGDEEEVPGVTVLADTAPIDPEEVVWLIDQIKEEAAVNSVTAPEIKASAIAIELRVTLNRGANNSLLDIIKRADSKYREIHPDYEERSSRHKKSVVDGYRATQMPSQGSDGMGR